MYTIIYTHQFKKSVKLCQKRGLNLTLLENVLNFLELNGQLPFSYKTHKLSGKYSNCWECHIQSDWLLIWKQDDQNLILLLLDTGTHSDLF
jgi:mRNA interferase YafQ